MRISLIAAVARNRAIGREGRMPWYLPADLRRFRALTTGHAVIMGRRTHESIQESIGTLLPGRRSIIVTRRPGYAVPGAEVFGSLDAALAALAAAQCAEVFIIGGAGIYREALPRADRIYLTEIHRDFEGDTFFPELPPATFVEVAREEHDEPFPFAFVTLERALARGKD